MLNYLSRRIRSDPARHFHRNVVPQQCHSAFSSLLSASSTLDGVVNALRVCEREADQEAERAGRQRPVGIPRGHRRQALQQIGWDLAIWRDGDRRTGVVGWKDLLQQYT